MYKLALNTKGKFPNGNKLAKATEMTIPQGFKPHYVRTIRASKKKKKKKNIQLHFVTSQNASGNEMDFGDFG